MKKQWREPKIEIFDVNNTMWGRGNWTGKICYWTPSTGKVCKSIGGSGGDEGSGDILGS